MSTDNMFSEVDDEDVSGDEGTEKLVEPEEDEDDGDEDPEAD